MFIVKGHGHDETVHSEAEVLDILRACMAGVKGVV